MADSLIATRTNKQELPIAQSFQPNLSSADIIALHFNQAAIANALSYMVMILVKEPQALVKAVRFGNIIYEQTLEGLPLPIDPTILIKISSLLSIAHQAALKAESRSLDDELIIFIIMAETLTSLLNDLLKICGEKK